ncbi:MAG: hypothetical protein HC922_04350 [Leptolyngbyaceae cyanobacterium SM2_3_12]|nr:hypothetical protein [Leptolyngbyaceae cyanobacterium SM2_3_12]
MTDTIAFNSAPEPQDDASTNNGQEPLPEEVSAPSTDWELVTFPGQVTIDDGTDNEVHIPPTVANEEIMPAPPEDQATSQNNGSQAPNSQTQNSTGELLELIQDLNHCNDALLVRVSELEEDLERSQVALQTEIERNQSQSISAGPVPHQIAQLLSELDIANDGLRRTTIHNEALQAELEASQQRVARLERECTLLQQRFGEKTTALTQAEETCRDLKARLQRQQRYTLQFKAALDKYLNMAANPNIASSSEAESELSPGVTIPTADVTMPTISMPKSRQIQPWSASPDGVSSNPSLDHLLRGLKAAAHGPQPSAPAVSRTAPFPRRMASSPPATDDPPNLSDFNNNPDTVEAFASPTVLPAPRRPEDAPEPLQPPSEASPRAIDPAAEDYLWQDFARMTEAERTVPPQASPSPSPAPEPGIPHPWEDQLATATEQPAHTPEPDQIPEPAQSPLAFTEPSPWGVPLSTPAPAPASVPTPIPATPSCGPTPASKPRPAASPSSSAPRPPAPAPTFATPPGPAAGLPAYLQGQQQASPSPPGLPPAIPEKNLLHRGGATA